MSLTPSSVCDGYHLLWPLPPDEWLPCWSQRHHMRQNKKLMNLIIRRSRMVDKSAFDSNSSVPRRFLVFLKDIHQNHWWQKNSQKNKKFAVLNNFYQVSGETLPDMKYIFAYLQSKIIFGKSKQILAKDNMKWQTIRLDVWWHMKEIRYLSYLVPVFPWRYMKTGLPSLKLFWYQAKSFPCASFHWLSGTVCLWAFW